MQGHRNGWLPGCTAMPGHWLIACGDVGETSAICCQEASRSDASLVLVLGFSCFLRDTEGGDIVRVRVIIMPA